MTAVGIATVLAKSAELRQVAGFSHAPTPEHALRGVRDGDVGLVVVDPHSPTLEECFELCRALKETARRPHVVAFGDLGSEVEFKFCYLSGVDSFVSTRESPERLAAAIASTLRGNREWLFGPPRDPRQQVSFGDSETLTSREHEVLWLVSKRCTNEQIGRSLSISPNTAKNHVASILRKMGAKRRSELFSGAISAR
ncbi:response regulator transcription factor [Allokutzneria sp. A3M-2-11 16]|uniref:helix-turn-helix transcriptional regulator n=1 Tax=Allokutzneria sp. A3M-2-11 16 TaxID=2962043 RepID=UPI0020B7BA42|nr:response regulator transcription factor [Allokutzneria sp. A3M-2-11 16]MCP3801371.1 response regulator transcription factor [Allokutzneria sp. A3M-2-11 16]